MKKDALYWGIVAAFGSFVLLIFWTALDVWNTSKDKQKIEQMTEQEEISHIRVRDYSRIETIQGDDGKIMVLISEGPFGMGSQQGEGDLDEFPYHISFLSAFYMDMHEVTFEEYARYAKATRSRDPVVPVFEEDLSLITAPHQPVVGVSWVQARNYCDWTDKRLPTEGEWEKAARGEEELKWPWGDTLGGTVANTGQGDDGYEYAAPPGQFEAGRSPYGVYDMAGNVAEWVQDVYEPNYYEVAPFKDAKGPEEGKYRVYRGGSWNDSFPNVRSAKRFAASALQSSAVIGFRCAKDA